MGGESNELGKIPQAKKVELLPAFVWTCPNCGIDKFERAVVPELTDEDKFKMRLEYGVEREDVEGLFMMAPTEVQCIECKTYFETMDFGEEDEDSDIIIPFPETL